MHQKLTPALVRDAAPPEKGDRIFCWDTAMPSFGLMVTAIVKYGPPSSAADRAMKQTTGNVTPHAAE
jgi:hypothetical protein